MKSRRKLIVLGAAILAIGAGAYSFKARSEDAPASGPAFMHGGAGAMMGADMTPGAMMGMMHDAATMAELRVIHTLFIEHDRIKRTVTNLPSGIRTVTESNDPQIAELLKTHVGDMMTRVRAGDDPGLPIESDALHSIFRDKDKIKTTVDATATGVAVTQTSNDPKVVAELQAHAGQVTDFTKEGMAAMRAVMMRKGNDGSAGMMMSRGMMHRMMRSPGLH